MQSFSSPLTAYASVKIRKKRISKKKLKEQRRIKELEKLYLILKVTGSSLSSIVLLRILQLRAGG